MNVQEKFKLQQQVEAIEKVVSDLDDPSGVGGRAAQKNLRHIQSALVNLMNPIEPVIRELLG